MGLIQFRGRPSYRKMQWDSLHIKEQEGFLGNHQQSNRLTFCAEMINPAKSNCIMLVAVHPK